MLRIAGYGQRVVAKYVGLNIQTVTRYYSRELKLTSMEASMKAAKALMGRVDEGHVQACIYILEKFAPNFLPPEKELEEIEGPIPVQINLPQSQWEAIEDGGPMERDE